MSIPVRQPVQIHINWGQARGLKQVQASLNASILRALKHAVNETIKVMQRIVPESEERVPPYPPSYKTERLMATAIAILTDSLAAQGRGGGLQKRYFIEYGYPAKYAKHINVKRNVKKWSKPGSETGFFGTAKQVLIQELRKALRFELSRPRAQQLELTKFIGTIETG